MFLTNISNIKDLILSKKIRYLVYSVVLTAVLYSINGYVVGESSILAISSLIVFLGLLGLIYSQFYDRRLRPTIFTLVMPAYLVIGYLLTFYYFPNLGPLVKILAYGGFLLMVYVIYLINNIFLVVLERGEIIPLYNAAITWVQILIIITSIPFLSGVFKTPLGYISQNLIVFVSSVMFNYYMIWVTHFDRDIKKTERIERAYLSFGLSFFVLLIGVGVSFFPNESFLRGLFVSTAIMFNLGYIHAYFKNRINKRLFIDYGIISLFFFLILIIFLP